MRAKSFGAFGLFGTGLAVGFGLATLGSAAGGYLTKIGPPALRYEVPPTAQPLPLPALPMEDKPAPEPAPVEPFQFTPTLTLMTDVVLSVLAERGLIMNPNPNSLLPEQSTVLTATSYAMPQVNNLQISPQMLVDFFRPVPGSTNGGGFGGTVPVEFMPAMPAALPASKATYKTQ